MCDNHGINPILKYDKNDALKICLKALSPNASKMMIWNYIPGIRLTTHKVCWNSRRNTHRVTSLSEQGKLVLRGKMIQINDDGKFEVYATNVIKILKWWAKIKLIREVLKVEILQRVKWWRLEQFTYYTIKLLSTALLKVKKCMGSMQRLELLEAARNIIPFYISNQLRRWCQAKRETISTHPLGHQRSGKRVFTLVLRKAQWVRM